MSPLEIVLVSVLSVVVFGVILYFIIMKVFDEFKANSVEDMQILNDYAEKGGIVFLGDSLTDFFPVSEFFPKLEIINRGIAGEQTKDVKARLADVLVLEPKVLFLQIGINDMSPNRKLTAEKLSDDIIDIAKAFVKSKVYVISLYPVNRVKMSVYRMICRHSNNKRISAVNELLKQKCEQNGIEFIDMYPELLDDKGNLDKEYTIEGLHLSIKGYTKVAHKLEPYLSKSNDE